MNSAMLRFTELFMDYKEKGMRVYEEPRLQQLATGIWQVSVRFPEEIRKNPDHRKRVSTKTKDKKLISSVQGVGQKMTERIFLEFKSALTHSNIFEEGNLENSIERKEFTSIIDDINLTLHSLNYSKKDIKRIQPVLNKYLLNNKNSFQSKNNAIFEILLKEAMSFLEKDSSNLGR